MPGDRRAGSDAAGDLVEDLRVGMNRTHPRETSMARKHGAALALVTVLAIVATGCTGASRTATESDGEPTPRADGSSSRKAEPPLPTDPAGTICVATDASQRVRVHTNTIAAPTADVTVVDVSLAGVRGLRQSRSWVYPDSGPGTRTAVTLAEGGAPLPDGAVPADGASLSAGTRYRLIVQVDPADGVRGGFRDVVVHYSNADHVGTARVGTRLVVAGSCS